MDSTLTQRLAKKNSGKRYQLAITDEFQAVESATSSVENLYKVGTLDPVYHAKTVVLNRALQEIGMGKYQVLPSWGTVHTPYGGRH